MLSVKTVVAIYITAYVLGWFNINNRFNKWKE